MWGERVKKKKKMEFSSPHNIPSTAIFRLPVSLGSFLLLHITLLLYAVISIFAKLAGLSMAAGEPGVSLFLFGLTLSLPGKQTLWYLGLEFSALLLYTILWQQVLRRMPLSFAYSNKAVCTLWTFLFGLLVFGEAFTFAKGVGLCVVILGVYLVVSDHE